MTEGQTEFSHSPSLTHSTHSLSLYLCSKQKAQPRQLNPHSLFSQLSQSRPRQPSNRSKCIGHQLFFPFFLFILILIPFIQKEKGIPKKVWWCGREFFFKKNRSGKVTETEVVKRCGRIVVEAGVVQEG